MSSKSVVTVLFAPPGLIEECRSGIVVELSDEGLFIASNTLWPPQTTLDLVLTIPGERLPVRLTGEVAWARSRDVAGMFVTFREPADHASRAKLSAHQRAPAAARAAKRD